MSLVSLTEMTNDMSHDEARVIIKKFYDGAYKHGLYKPTNGKVTWSEILDLKMVKDFRKALDVGCGTGAGMALAVEKGKDVYGIDLADASEQWKKNGVSDRCQVAPANKIPFGDNEFDLVVCADVLEHIPEYDIVDSLKEMLRVGSDKFMFIIALKDELSPVGGKVKTHITVRDNEWWFDRLMDAGFTDGFMYEQKPGAFHLSVIMEK